ncbi:MAG: prepilin-type N-terminal cleavage/methylation domain-containing protein [Deltaproteobacteria bacterium]|nr:prepilin-type N-terminal cleavage/methylation domain-containing protein [Deltaproteobacteria bacterium]
MYSNQKGFTLIEIMVSLVVTLVIVAGAYAVFAIQNKSANVQNEVATMQQNGRIAMDVLVEEIRRGAYNNPANPAGATITVDASGSMITIQKDVNDDGVINDTLASSADDEEWIVLQVNGNNQLTKQILRKSDGSDVQTLILADNIYSLSFSPAGVTDPSSVDISLTVRTKHEDPNWTDTNKGVNLSGSVSDGLARIRNYQKTVWVRNLNL